MRILSLAFAAIVLASAGSAQALPTVEQAGNAALGGAVGGLLGNQVGNGRGRTLATAAGAATGVVIASGCKVTAGTALGGLIGGLLGSQVGGGNGSNVMAGVGAGVGALLGSDCQPGAEPVPSAPIPTAAPFMINGVRLTPMNGFPQEAFFGLPPIVTPDDLFAASKMVRLLTDQSAKSRADGNPELAILQTYWAKRIATTSISILAASLNAIHTNKGDTATIPAKGLVILPAYNNFAPAGGSDRRVLLDAAHELMAASEYAQSKGVMVADANGFGSVMGLLGALGGAAPQQPQQQQQQAAQQPPAGLIGIPQNTVLQMDNGTQIYRSKDALTIHNPNLTPATVSLLNLDFMPRTFPLSQERKNAAPMMFTVNNSERDWAFNDYARRVNGGFTVRLSAPNVLIDERKGDAIVGALDSYGQVDIRQRADGERAYRTNLNYRNAIDLLSGFENSTLLKKHEESCRAGKMGSYYTLDGQDADMAQAVCFAGRYTDKNTAYVRTFLIREYGDAGEAFIQDEDSAMRDMHNQMAMTDALTSGKAFSDMTAFVPGYSNVEAGLQCTGEYTIAQQNYVGKAVLQAKGAKDRIRTIQSSNRDLALMAGWTPPPADEWSFDRVVNCVTALPLVGYAGSTVKLMDQVGNRVYKELLLSADGEKRIEILRNITDAFATPALFRKYMKDIGNVQSIFPNNPSAASFTKMVYDALMWGQNMNQTVDGIQNYKP